MTKASVQADIEFFRHKIQSILRENPANTPYDVMRKLMLTIENIMHKPFAVTLLKTLEQDAQQAWQEIDKFLTLNRDKSKDSLYYLFIAYFYYYGDFVTLHYPLASLYPALNKFIHTTIPPYLNQTVWVHAELLQMLRRGLDHHYFDEAKTITLTLLNETNKQSVLAENKALADIFTSLCTEQKHRCRSTTHFKLLAQLDLPASTIASLYNTILQMDLRSFYALPEIEAVIFKIGRAKPEIIDINALLSSTSPHHLKIACDYVRTVKIPFAQLEPLYPRFIELLQHDWTEVSAAAGLLLVSDAIPENKQVTMVNAVIDVLEQHIRTVIYYSETTVKMRHALLSHALPEPCRRRLIDVLLNAVERFQGSSMVPKTVNDLISLDLTTADQTKLINKLRQIIEANNTFFFYEMKKFKFPASDLVTACLNITTPEWAYAYQFAYTSQDYQQISSKLNLALDTADEQLPACKSIRYISDEFVPEISRKLLDLLQMTTNSVLKRAILKALQFFTPPTEYMNRLIQQLRALTQDPDEEVRERAYKTLRKYSDLANPVFTEAELLGALAQENIAHVRKEIFLHICFLSMLSPASQQIILSNALRDDSDVAERKDTLLYALKVSTFDQNHLRQIMDCCIKLSFKPTSPRYQYLVNMPRTLDDNHYIISSMLNTYTNADLVLHTIYQMPIASEHAQSLCERLLDNLNVSIYNKETLLNFFKCLNYLARSLPLEAKTNIWIRLEGKYRETGTPYFLLFSHTFRRDHLVRERLEQMIQEKNPVLLPDEIWYDINSKIGYSR